MLRRLRQWIDRRIERRLTRTRTLHGITVTVMNRRTDIDEETLWARTDAALALIATVDPRRFRRMARDFSVLHVRRGFTRGAFYQQSRACVLDNTFVANPQFTITEVAACLVHEAMHARVQAMGVTRGRDDRAHEERICRKAEIAFAERAPDGERVIARARAALESVDTDVAPTIDYAEVQRRVMAADLAASPAPMWLKRWVARRQGLTLPG